MPDPSDAKPSRRFDATTPSKRFFKLAGMSANIMKNVASHTVKGLFNDRETQLKNQQQLYSDIGRDIAETLGEMKGAVMKVGQIASQVKDLFPREVASALEVLQKASPPMPYDVIRRQIIRQLGDTPENLFAHFEPQPFAAASIGQVHRATTHDSQDVVVKIQYPGVKDSCNSDLKHLKRLLKLAGLFKVSNAVIDETFEEIKRMLYEELDYEHEAQNIDAFNQLYVDHPYIELPKWLPELSSEAVLTLTYLQGDALSEVKAPRYSQSTIDLIGYRLFESFGHQIFDLHLLHSDPHPGNFAFRPDGTLILYDFGAVKQIPAETVTKLRQLIGNTMDDELEAMDATLLSLGVRRENGKTLGRPYYQEWSDILMPPFRNQEPYAFKHSDLHINAIEKVKKDALKYLGYFQMAPEIMHIDRVIVGHYWTMVELGVNASFRPLIDSIVLHRTPTTPRSDQKAS